MTNTDNETREYILARTADNSAFSKNPQFAGLQIAWDSTSLGILKSCPYKYYLSMIEGYQPKIMADPLLFGIAFHSAMEIYEKVVIKHGHDQAQIVALRIAMDEYGHEDEVDHETGELLPWVPHNSDPDKKDYKLRTREALARAVIWYLEHYKDSNMKTLILPSGKPAAELSFRFELGISAPPGDDYLLCGHLDKVISCNGAYWVNDYKTSKSTLGDYFFAGFSPGNQMSLYDFAGSIVLDEQIAGVIIDGIQLMTNSTRFGRGFAPRSPGQRDEWVHDLKTIIKQAEFYVENLQWPMNDTACSMYGGCDFKRVCSQDPSVRQTFLNADFVRRIWNPLKER